MAGDTMETIQTTLNISDFEILQSKIDLKT